MESQLSSVKSVLRIRKILASLDLDPDPYADPREYQQKLKK